MPAARRAKLLRVEHTFGRSAPFTVGIEEEFQLMSTESYELVPRFDEVADAAGDERIRRELMTSVLETATGVHETIGAAIAEVREIRTLLREAAAARGALIASAGTHPFSHWEHQEITEKPRYQGSSRSCAGLPSRLRSSGCTCMLQCRPRMSR